MMIKPGVGELMKKDNVDSRYTLVCAVAKRARELQNEDAEPMVETASDKPVTIAVEEIADGHIDILPAIDRSNTEE